MYCVTWALPIGITIHCNTLQYIPNTQELLQYIVIATS